MTEHFLEPVAVAAARIARFADSLLGAHELGHGPGGIDDLWSISFHTEALPVYLETIPWEYLVRLARGFRSIGETMAGHRPRPEIEADWTILESYLRSASGVMLDQAPITTCDADPIETIDGEEPSVMQFADLAKIASVEGATRLIAAGQAVSSALALISSPLSQDDLRILDELCRAPTLIVAADRLGYSERTVRRRKSHILRTLGVANPAEAMVLAVRNGWL